MTITRIAAALAAPLLLALPLAAPALADDDPVPSAKDYPPPPAGWHVARTAWGDPDLRGMWPVDYLTPTPRERPPEVGTRTEWTPEEYNQRFNQAEQAQGLITQQVTNYLNTAGVVTGLLLVVHAINTRHWALLACFGVFAAAQAGLLFMHVRLDRMLSGDVTGFYDVHRVYLLITAIQWLAGMAALWFILQKTRSCPELPTS